MAKQLNKWLDEFVENGADPKNVIEWPENAGGGSSMILEPLHSGQAIKVTIDFSIYTYTDKGAGWDYIADFIPGSVDSTQQRLVIDGSKTDTNNCMKIYGQAQDESGYLFFLTTWWDYTSLSNEVFVETGSTPIVEFTISVADVPNDWMNRIPCNVENGIKIEFIDANN